MVHSIVDDVTTVKKSDSCFSPLKYKKRNVSAKREFPQNCGRNAPRTNLEPKKDCLVSVKDCAINNAKREDNSLVLVKRECPESRGRCVSLINTESNEDGISVKSFESLDLETDGAFVDEQLGSLVKLGSFEVIECTGQIESPDLPKDLLSKTKTSLEDLNQLEVLEHVKTLDPMVISSPRSLDTKSVRSLNTPQLRPKPRKCGIVSAHREFPEGCGQNTPLINEKSKESGGSVEKMKAVTDGAHAEPLSVNQSGGLVELQVPTSSGQIESNDLLLLKGSISDATVKDEVEQMAETVLEEDTYDTKLQGIIIIIDDNEDKSEVKSTRAGEKEIVDFVHGKDDLESKLNEEIVVETSIGKQIVRDNAKQMREKLQNDDTFTRRLQEIIIITDDSEDEAEVKLAEVEENKIECVHGREYFDRKLKEEVIGETSNQSPWKNSISQSDPNSPPLSKKVVRGCESSGEKLGVESEKFCENTSSERKFPKESVDKICTVNQSEVQLLGSAHSSKSLVVQALMAAPNCPWNFGKQTSKFPSDPKSPFSSKNVDRMSESAGEKLDTESLKFSKDLSLKIKFPDESVHKVCAVNQSEMQLLGLDHSIKRLVVQALMAPNCPWNLGKQTSKFPSDPESPSSSKDVNRGGENSEEKLGTESSQFSEDLSLKRKFPGESSHGYCALNQSQIDEFFGFGHSDERVVVQALLTSPNCPWTMGKGTSKSPSGLSNAKVKSKQSKLELFVQNDSKCVSRRKNGGTAELDVKFTKKKISPGHVSYEDALQLALVEEDNNTRHDMEDDGLLVQESHNVDLSLVPYGFHKLIDIDDNIEANNTNNKVKESLLTDQASNNRDLSVIPFGLHSSLDTDDGNIAGVTRTRVRETLRLFQGLLRKIMQDAESKSKNARDKPSGRADLVSSKILKEKNKWVNTGKPILGTVPGVEVGDEFHYRAELAIIGLHRPYQGGIDYSKMNGKILATSVVASGGYPDDMDSSDVLKYSGQGGLPNGDKEAEDQKLERGNLSLKNSYDERTPVRVIRGFKEPKWNDSSDSKGKMVATYTYDGLYLVEKYWEEIGSYGTKVFKFELRRIPGQPELAIKEVKKSKKSRLRKGLCVDDISQGREMRRICAINTMDDEKPPLFEYITDMIYPPCYNRDTPKGCDCIGGCSDSETCFCAIKNGGEIPFNYDGAIVEAKPLVYECGPSCKCPPSCHNRVSQKGIKFQLEIFKTESRGWGVRSLTSIPSGSFICEYTGELLEDKEAEKRTSNDEYLFDIGHNYNDPALWEGVSNLVPIELRSSSSREYVDNDNMDFTIDAAHYGSVGRFINHSCSPNLYAQNVLYDHDDNRMPHIMLFAAENIPPLQELTYHYNYELDQVLDSNGNIRKKNCYCGSDECTGRLY